MRFEAAATGGYVSRGLLYSLELGANGPSFRMGQKQSRFTMRFDGAKPVAPVGESQMGSRTNYLVGDAKNWRRDVVNFAKVRYPSAWPGIDAVFYGNQQRLEYDLELQPGADPGRVAFRFEGVEHLRIAADGALLIRAGGNEIRQLPPLVYQEGPSGRQTVKGRYVLRAANTVGFVLEGYDKKRKLVIDPIIDYSTFIGGNIDDFVTSVALDASGNIYLAGLTESTNLSLPGAYDTTVSAYDLFVVKLDPTGTQAFWSTYFGGSGDEDPWGIVVDSRGQATVVGNTTSKNLPVRFDATQIIDNWFSNSSNIVGDQGFIVKLNAAGSNVVYSNYVGGTTDSTFLWHAVIDKTDNVFLTGETYATDFPTYRGLNQFYGTRDTVVMKIDPVGNRVFSSLIGGTTGGGEQSGFAMALNAQGAIYLTGVTNSTNFPNGLFTKTHPDYGDVYVLAMASDGQTLNYINFLGGTRTATGDLADGLQESYRIVADARGNVHVTGYTATVDFGPIIAPIQQNSGGGTDVFYARLNATLDILNSTYLGGTGADWGLAMAVDPVSGNIVLGGLTNSSNFPVRPNAVQRTFGGGGADGFITTISGTDGQTIVDSTFYGGSQTDFPVDLTVGPDGAIYIAGYTESRDFPISQTAIIPYRPNPETGFLARLTNYNTCRFSVGTGQVQVPTAGVSASFTVAISGVAGCIWSASTTAPSWISLGSTRGNGINLSYRVSANTTGAARDAYIIISGQVIHVTQFGQDCQFSAYPDRIPVPNAASTRNISILAPSSSCGWTPSSDSSWIRVPSTQRSGSGSLAVAIDANTGATLRGGSITIGNLRIPVVQNGSGCRLQVTSGQGPFEISGGNGLARVQASST
ncbi:MAG: BACON domain-containing carbohydrate-binding protein, partial [Bryobacteraceae bacterium]